MFSIRLSSRRLPNVLHQHFVVPATRTTRTLSTDPAQQLIKFEESFARRVKLKVCSRFAEKPSWLRPWFLRYIPRGGHEMMIDYIDTMPNAPNDGSVKTIVILHNTPGSYYDFFKFISVFGNTFRIIVPNFPEFSQTLKTGEFWHSSEEKSELVFDLLKHLGVGCIDCLVAHSLSVYTASYLWLYSNDKDYVKLRSVCLLSPTGRFKYSRAERTRFNLIAFASRWPALRNLIPKSKVTSPNTQGKPSSNLASKLEFSGWVSLTEKLSNYESYNLRLRALAHLQIPTLFVYSTNDKLVRPRVFHDQLFELNVNVDCFDIYEQYENILIQASTDQSWIKVIDFRSGRHYIFNTHAEIIHSYIDELINRIDLRLPAPSDSQQQQLN